MEIFYVLLLCTQTLRTSSEHRQPEKAIKDEEGNEEKDEERHLSMVHFSGGKNQFFNQTWRLNSGYMKAILRGHFLSVVSVTGRQRKKRKEELRLQAAQARAAVSVAQLAAAIAGIVSVCELRPDNLKCVEAADSKKMGTVLASAAALVATVCAEAAELAGTNRSGVTSAVKTGLESCSSAELLTLTATAATCLRGAAALKLRADVRGIGSNNNSVGTSTTSIHKDTTLRVRLPCGSVRLRKVAVFPQCDRVVLRLGKKHLQGAFSTYKNYEVLDVSSNGGDVAVDGMVFFPLVLSTAAGVVQLLLDSQLHRKALGRGGPKVNLFQVAVACIRTDLPELESHTLVALTPEGLLLLLHQRTLLLRLLNPLTRHLTDLPPVTALLTPEQLRSWHSDGGLEDDPLLARGVGLASATTVALFLCRPKLIAVAKPGDECWAVVVADKNRPYIDSALPFAGRFYCAIGGNHGGRPRLVTAAQPSKPLCFSRMSGTIHLVDNGGELMLVYRKIRQSNVDEESRQGAAKYEMKYDVYRVDFDAGDLIPVKGLGGRAVFLGLCRSVSLLPAEAFLSIAADTLYLGFDCREKTEMNEIDGYNVADGSSEPCHLDCIFLQMLQQPYSFVNCLSHCIQGIGDHLA
uniref:DUF295 domain-containing protein n=1 Tax=Oryza meridionalis TaxID=40149 RepID=A0A0E0E9T5_9ORYZ